MYIQIQRHHKNNENNHQQHRQHRQPHQVRQTSRNRIFSYIRSFPGVFTQNTYQAATLSIRVYIHAPRDYQQFWVQTHHSNQPWYILL